MYEQPPAPRRVGPALIAVLLVLATVAGIGSYLVVRRVLIVRAGAGTPAASGTRTPSAPRSEAPIPIGAQTTPRVTARPGDPATSCPAITVKAVTDAGRNGELKLLRYVDATLTGFAGAEAWVCKNADGVLFYQGHRKSGAFDAATGNDALLLGRGILGKVDTEGDTGFVAVNPVDTADPDDPNHTEYHVSATSFFFVKLPQGNKTEYGIVRTVG